MAGKVTLRVELKDGTVVQYERDWTGGNPLFEGAEAELAGKAVASTARQALEATHGKLPQNAVL